VRLNSKQAVEGYVEWSEEHKSKSVSIQSDASIAVKSTASSAFVFSQVSRFPFLSPCSALTPWCCAAVTRCGGVAEDYGVALVSRINKIIDLFCKRALQKSQYSAKETYNFIDPTNRSHPMKPSAAAQPRALPQPNTTRVK